MERSEISVQVETLAVAGIRVSRTSWSASRVWRSSLRGEVQLADGGELQALLAELPSGFQFIAKSELSLGRFGLVKCLSGGSPTSPLIPPESLQVGNQIGFEEQSFTISGIFDRRNGNGIRNMVWANRFNDLHATRESLYVVRMESDDSFVKVDLFAPAIGFGAGGYAESDYYGKLAQFYAPSGEDSLTAILIAAGAALEA